MWKFSAALVIFTTIFLTGNCQVHYVPAQILIPTLNISYFNNTNSFANRTNSYGSNYNNVLAHHTPQVLPSAVLNSQQGFVGNGSNQSRWFWNQTTSTGDLIVGQIGYLDYLLFKQEYFKPRRWWSSRDKTIDYPKDRPGSFGRNEIISAIRVYNKFYDGLDSRVRIISGGVGQRYVKIEISSNWGKGFKYDVQLFGH